MRLRNSTLLLVSALLLTTVVSCGKKASSAPQGPHPVNVTVESVALEVAAYFESYPGTLKALQEVELRPQVSGYITGIHFNEGDQVKEGQKLYTIDQQQTQAAYQQALANLAVQESNLEKATKDAERYRELSEKDAIARQQLDYAESALVAAKKQVDAAKAAVSSAQTNVRYSVVTAPFDGTIGISQVRLGAAVSPGQTLLNTLSSNDPIGVEVTIDQSVIPVFHSLLNGTPSDSAFQLLVNKRKYVQFGKLSLIDRAVDPQTGTIKVRVEFPNKELLLRPGMSAQLLVLSNTDKPSMTVPIKAVTEQLGEFYVYVVDSSKVSQRKIVPGKQVGKDIIVEKGLTPGETIVTEGVQNLREGSAINATPSAPKTN